MKTMKIFSTVENGSTLIGEFTNSEYKTFMNNAETFMRNMSDAFPHLVFIRGVWSVHLWDENKHKTVLTYSGEFISDDYRF